LGQKRGKSKGTLEKSDKPPLFIYTEDKRETGFLVGARSDGRKGGEALEDWVLVGGLKGV